MSNPVSRREVIKSLTLLGGALIAGAAARRSAAADGALPHVGLADPVAVALSYHESAATVEAAKFPNYKPEQKCSNCLQAKGQDGDAWRPCNLFPGKLVSAGGWCKVYVKKP